MDKKLFLALAFALLCGLVTAQDCGFDGVWGTDWGDMTLTQAENVVTGTYTHDSGKISGTVSGGILKGKWSESPSYAEPSDAGDIEFAISGDCSSFTGKWRYGSTGDMSSGWAGTRKTEVTRTGGASKALSSGQASLVWIGKTEDKVSPGGESDGTPDGHFRLTLDVSGTKTVTGLLLASADSSGNDAGGQYWDTDPNYYWVLGVEQPAGTRLNPKDESISKTISGKTVFELYASDSGYFNSGQYYKATVTYSEESSVEAITTSGNTNAAGSQGTTSSSSTSTSQSGGVNPTGATTATTTTIATSIGPKDPTAGICKGTTPYIYIEDRVMEKGKEVRIPVIMCNARDLANMDLSLNYNTGAMKFKSAEKGALNAKSLFESNEKTAGTIKISFAASQGVTGSGSIAILIYDVIGSNGQSTQITGSVNSASTSGGSPVSVSVNPGTFTVGSGVTGDCDGDGLVSSRDALAALQMAVEKIKIDMCYDVNSDGKVNSADARDILRRAAGGGK